MFLLPQELSFTLKLTPFLSVWSVFAFLYPWLTSIIGINLHDELIPWGFHSWLNNEGTVLTIFGGLPVLASHLLVGAFNHMMEYIFQIHHTHALCFVANLRRHVASFHSQLCFSQALFLLFCLYPHCGQTPWPWRKIEEFQSDQDIRFLRQNTILVKSGRPAGVQPKMKDLGCKLVPHLK